jgi:sulfite reductase (NADPH) flavoprotein alpha-component
VSKEVKTLCPYCGVGCGLLASTDGVRITKVRGDSKHPANFGKLCPKGGSVAQTLDVATRLRSAMIRTRDANPGDRTSTPFTAVTPSRAIERAATKLRHILDTYGPESIAFYLSGQMTTEAQYLAGKFAKACLRTNHCDSNSRLCMSSAAAGMNLSLGSDGPPTCYDDIDHADGFLFVGSNAADCHPVTFGRVKDRLDRGAKCVVVDPRKTATAQAAHVHLPVKPGTDLALLNGLLHCFAKWGKLDPAFIANHTEGWAELEAILPDYPPDRVARLCNIPEADFLAAAKLLADRPKLLTLWTMGVSQSTFGTFNANAIINLHLATGRIGKVGAGPFSLTGQPNAMGGRDTGYMSHQLPGQRFVANPDHRTQMEKLWGLEPGTVGKHPGYDAVRLFDAAAHGEIKAIWIIGTNPAASLPNLKVVRAGLEAAELVIVQDAYHPTETTKYAHVLLPAAVNLEQTGTFCNTERRVSLMEQVVQPPGNARPDWWWVQQVAQAMGFNKGMSFTNAAAIFDEFARTTAGRPNDQSALHHKLLRERGPQQWPYPAMGRPAARRYEDHAFPTPGGRAKFFAREHADFDAADRPSRAFPVILTTGRVYAHWHTRTKTAHVPALEKLDPAPYVQMHPDDAAALGLHDRQHVHVASRFGRATTFLRLDAAITPGLVFMPIHWNDLWAQGSSPNESTSTLKDPVSKQPALKAVAVTVTPVLSEPAVLGPALAEGVWARGGTHHGDPEKQRNNEAEKRE